MQTQTFHQGLKPTSKPQIGPQHEHLEEFIGEWRLKQKDGLTKANVPQQITGVDTYQWMDGNYFLLFTFHRYFDRKLHKGIGVIGYNEATRKYFATFYDNLGYARDYDVELDFQVMRFHGQWERGTVALSRDHKVMDIHWEQTKDGANWSALCDIEGLLVADFRTQHH
jgi:hypothetical protein